MMRKRAQAARWLSGRGIEIGALHQPLAVPAGCRVTYVDRLPLAELRAHYPELRANDLVRPSIVAGAEDLGRIESGSQDFVIANHLLEHLEDPIRGLAEMTRVLRPGGILYLALPDPRYTFDRPRQRTTLEHVVDEYRNGTEATRRAHYVEWVTVVEEARGQDPEALMARRYSIHFHVWSPRGFDDVLRAARTEAGVALELVEFLRCQGGDDIEYINVLRKP